MQSVFVTGMPRCGSMWTYNVTRALIKASGQTLIPESVPANELEFLAELENTVHPEADVCCIKTHQYIKPVDSSNLKLICNYRDVRDAMLSFMRFTHCTFEEGIESVKSMMHITNYYAQMGEAENLLALRYEEVMENPESTAEFICLFLELEVSDRDIQAIMKEFSRKNVKKKLEQIKVSKFQALMQYLHKRPDLYDLVENFDGSHRVYLKESGFQTNHITDTQPGEWREVFSSEQKTFLLHLTADWLAQYNYDVDRDVEDLASSGHNVMDLNAAIAQSLVS